jgi:hypothetical protein
MATAAEYSRTGARTANLPGRRFDHVFFTSMALVTSTDLSSAAQDRVPSFKPQ